MTFASHSSHVCNTSTEEGLADSLSVCATLVYCYSIVGYRSITWDASYLELLELFSVPNLQQRKLYLDLCSMFIIVHGLFYFPNNVFPHCNSHRVTRSSNPQTFICLFARTNNSYVPRSIRLWNSLPMSITDNNSLTSVSSFKLSLRAHIYH